MYHVKIRALQSGSGYPRNMECIGMRTKILSIVHIMIQVAICVYSQRSITISNNFARTYTKTIFRIRYAYKNKDLISHFCAKKNKNYRRLRETHFHMCIVQMKHLLRTLDLDCFLMKHCIFTGFLLVLLEGFLFSTPFTLALYPASTTELKDAVLDHY